MAVDFKGKSLLKMVDLSPEELRYLISLSREFKQMKRAGVAHKRLEGKNIVLLFEKTSTRTRCAFEVAAYDLGMGVTYLDAAGSQMGKKESIADTARVLGRMYDGIEYRGYSQALVEELAQKAGVPVWNGLTDEAHPTQMIADMMTIEEHFGSGLAGLKLVFMGDAENNVGASLMAACAKLGMHFVACGPKKCMPREDFVEQCSAIAHECGGSVTLTEDVNQACAGAHVIYTDIWVSMGEPDYLWAERIKLMEPYRVTSEVMAMADPHAIFMHCLPSFHDVNTDIGAQIAGKFGITEMEVTDEVFESERSKVFDEAENRMHSIKAIMYASLA